MSLVLTVANLCFRNLRRLGVRPDELVRTVDGASVCVFSATNRYRASLFGARDAATEDTWSTPSAGLVAFLEKLFVNSVQPGADTGVIAYSPSVPFQEPTP